MEIVKPAVLKCDAGKCAYNAGGVCHAIGINIGSPHQRCDTFKESNQKAGNPAVQAEVGACDVTECAFNNMMLCSSPGINVSMHIAHADCMTFNKRA